MVSVSPWSVKGVDPEAREAAKIAARRSGMTVGQWLSHTIRAAAAQQLAGASQGIADPAASPAAHLAPASQGGGALEPQDHYPVDTRPTLEAGPLAPTPHMVQPPQPPMRLNEAILENILRLSNRIDESEFRTQAAVAPLVNQVEQLSEKVEQVRAQSTQSTTPVERAVARLAQRLEKIEAARQAEMEGRRWSLFSNTG